MSLVLTVDVEDWAQSTLDPGLPITDRAQRNTERLLDLLASHERKVTCFVLGLFARSFPETVRRMVREGHEVASHGYGHVNAFEQTPEAFREDVRRAKALLEDVAGVRVEGYRGPDYSVGRVADWALEILAEEGHVYDSSLVPSRHSRNGRPDWPADPVRVVLPSGSEIVELPVATIARLGRRWPVAGGGYHRLLPWWVIRRVVGSALGAGRCFIAYCHPYEFDPAELAESHLEIPWKTRLHQGLGRRGFEEKFVRMIEMFPSTLACRIAKEGSWSRFPLPASK